MQTEIGGDLLERHTGIASASDPDDIVTELSGIGLGHVDILSGPPHGQARSGVTEPRGSPSILTVTLRHSGELPLPTQEAHSHGMTRGPLFEETRSRSGSIR